MHDKDFNMLEHRAKRCTTHHYGCDCREYERIKALRKVEEQAEEIERLLKGIHLLGAMCGNPHSGDEACRLILKKCKELKAQAGWEA